LMILHFFDRFIFSAFHAAILSYAALRLCSSRIVGIFIVSFSLIAAEDY
jgi:transketolase